MTLIALSFSELFPLISTFALPLIMGAVLIVLLIFAITMTIVRRVLRAKAAAAVGAAVVGKIAKKKKGKKQQAEEPAAEEPTETSEQ